MRSFTIYKIEHKDFKNNLGGRYINDTPLDAAKKAFNHILIDNKSKKITFSIHMKETTRNSKHKIYNYVLTRIRKNEPVTVNKDGTKIIYNYDVFTKDKKITKLENKDKSKRYKCSNKEKQDKLTSVCCSGDNSLSERTYKSCKKHILNIRK